MGLPKLLQFGWHNNHNRFKQKPFHPCRKPGARAARAFECEEFMIALINFFMN
jgi:hypothetical protein